MQLHELKQTHKKKPKKRIGRGGKKGTYSGRGIKGQKSRAGGNLAPVIRGFIKRYPKLRGYRFKSRIPNIKSQIATVNLDILEKKFNSGEAVTPQILLERRIVCRMGGRTPRVKILGDGKLAKSLFVEGCRVSRKAKEQIEKAGGKVEF